MPTSSIDAGRLMDYWQDVAHRRRGPHPDDASILAANRHKLILDRAPEPWFGRPDRAKVFFLTLNPGHDPTESDAIHARYDAFLYRMLLKQGSLTEFHRSAGPGAIRWFRRTYGAFAERPDAFEAICNLRLVAYPSVSSGDLGALEATDLPSSRLMSVFVHGTLVPRARRGEIALLVMRSPLKWGFEAVTDDRVEGGLFLSRPGLRSASISPTSRVGPIVQRILDGA